jgi:hypothetical protein
MLSFRLHEETIGEHVDSSEQVLEDNSLVEKKKQVTSTLVSKNTSMNSVSAEELIDKLGEAGSGKVVSLCSNEEWHELLESLQVSGLVRELYRNTVYVGRRVGELDLYLSEKHEKLAQPSVLKTLEEKVSFLVGESLKIRLVAITSDQELSLAEQTMANEDEAQKNAENNIRQDPNVKVLMDEFGATLEQVSRRNEENE